MPEFHFLTTHLGSVPHLSPGDLPNRLTNLLDIPAWTQHPRRSFRESMYAQFIPGLPAIIVDEKNEKVSLGNLADYSAAQEEFYSNYLSDNLEAFALRPDYAPGFFAMLQALGSRSPSTDDRSRWAKGQVTGPISFGLTVTDQDRRASLYNDTQTDLIVKIIAMLARWQVRKLKSVRENVIIFLDEPYMAAFGSAFVSLSREQVIRCQDEVYTAIQAEGALGGVHCCANTDWGLLLSTGVDILNLDAFAYLPNLALYPLELRNFLDRGGSICWGLIPNNELILTESAEALASRLQDGINLICQKAAGRGVRILPAEFATHSLLAPACGLGSTSVEIADRVFDMLAETSHILKGG